MFRAAIGVECNSCHVFGEDMTGGHTNERQLDGNPKKLIARNMLHIVKRVSPRQPFPAHCIKSSGLERKLKRRGIV